MLLVLAPLASLSLAGQEHGRTIPLAVIGRSTVLRMPISRSRLGALPLKSPELMLSWKTAATFKEQTSFQKHALRAVNSFASSTVLKQDFNGNGGGYLLKEITMKLVTLALASAFSLSSTFALAYTNPNHHRSGARTHHGAVGMSYAPTYGGG